MGKLFVLFLFRVPYILLLILPARLFYLEHFTGNHKRYFKWTLISLTCALVISLLMLGFWELAICAVFGLVQSPPLYCSPFAWGVAMFYIFALGYTVFCYNAKNNFFYGKSVFLKKSQKVILYIPIATFMIATIISFLNKTSDYAIKREMTTILISLFFSCVDVVALFLMWLIFVLPATIKIEKSSGGAKC